MARIERFNQGRANQDDEYYTRYDDIQNEINHYRTEFEGKTVFCNCDDPYESNFFKYFAMNFNALKLKKLIATSYSGSPVVGKELNCFIEFDKEQKIQNKVAYKVSMSELKDTNNDGSEDLFDVQEIIKHRIRYLNGDGSFQSEESIELLKQADIVVTNPPFSLFRDYLSLLMKYKKKFIVIGNLHAITYKEVFPWIKNNEIWLGYNHVNSFKHADGTIKKFGNILWYTNLDIPKRHEKIDLYKSFDPKEYPKYDNYDAIEVKKVDLIPYDYNGMMGVPISFLEKYSPDQFEIIGFPTASSNKNSLNLNNDYSKYIGYKQNGDKTGRTGSTFGACPVFERNDKKGIYYSNGERTVQAGSCERIFIRRIN